MDSIEALRRMLHNTDEEMVLVSLGDHSMKLSTKALMLALAKPVPVTKTSDKGKKK